LSLERRLGRRKLFTGRSNKPGWGGEKDFQGNTVYSRSHAGLYGEKKNSFFGGGERVLINLRLQSDMTTCRGGKVMWKNGMRISSLLKNRRERLEAYLKGETIG